MQIDWMTLAYIVIGFSAVVGFFRGWWKAAVTTVFLIFFIILLQRPDWAQFLINSINWLIATVWQIVVDLFNLSPVGGPFQLDVSNPQTWIMILIFFLVLSALISGSSLPSHARHLPGTYYTVSFFGRLLGALLGGLNGFLILSLVREYLDGRALPGGAAPETELTVAGSSAFGAATNSVAVQAVNLPSTTILDSYLPWLIIGLGLLILLAVINTRVKVMRSKAGSKIAYVPPYGYHSQNVSSSSRSNNNPQAPLAADNS